MGLINVFRPAREEVIGERRKLHYGKVSDLHYPPRIIWVIISRSVRYVANVGETWNCVRGFDAKNFKQDLEVDGLVRVLVKCFLKRQGSICGQDSSGSRDTNGGL